MARPRPPGHHHLLVLLGFAVAVLLPTASAIATETDVLLAFRDTLRGEDGAPPPQLRAWGTPGPCHGNVSMWYGVSCHGNGSVQGLQLERLGLAGPGPDLSALAVLPGLRALSLSDNALTGPFPNVSALGVLKMLYLSRNRLGGVIPDGTFGPMRGLRKLHLADNDFSGPIPSSITSPRLLELSLAHNRFEGELPDFWQPELRYVDVSYNDLSGPIPDGLRRFNATMFAANENLCGEPLDVACGGSSAMSEFIAIAVVLIVVGVLLGASGVAAAVLSRRRRRRPRHAATETLGGSSTSNQTPSKPKLHTPPAVSIEPAGAAAGKRGPRRDEHGRLVFIQEGRVRFEIEDLLRASAEVLGSGNFGSSYKATLCEGPSVVVKRFKEMNGLGREDFQEHMRRLGRLAHPNLLPVVGYLFKKEEKLLVTDYMVNGSLAHLLHGNRGASLDWAKRLKIIKGVARGLAHLYDELPMLTVPHGHLKSSNVLLDASFNALLTDYALVPVVTAQHAAQVMVAYKAPECAAQGKPSKKSDVWSLGILILELLTGKFPANYLRQGRQQGTELAGWVNSVVSEKRTGEVFDKDMRGAAMDGEGELLKLLQVGMGCCEAHVDKRWDLKTAVARIEELKEPEAVPGDGHRYQFNST